ncbi:unnamed protein product [Hymenolepis diminuta]|uniref:Uncharacterized protein n=1 Tax=Hymenolepis diminuta TaxID=6216 RepID=A0A564XZA3_HYMDI|nr:unnamed protein product [Hymenolepis diminuta]
MTTLRLFVHNSYKVVFVFNSKDNANLTVTGSYAYGASPLFLSKLLYLSVARFKPVVASWKTF